MKSCCVCCYAKSWLCGDCVEESGHRGGHLTGPSRNVDFDQTAALRWQYGGANGIDHLTSHWGLTNISLSMLGKHVVITGGRCLVRCCAVVLSCANWSVTPLVVLTSLYHCCEFGVAPGCALYIDASAVYRRCADIDCNRTTDKRSFGQPRTLSDHDHLSSYSTWFNSLHVGNGV
jgi:hypothetical protein